MQKYIALFETDKNADGVGVVFPDIPECNSGGKNFDDAYLNAHEILTDILDDMLANGEPLPQPRTLEEIKQHWPDWKEWEDNYDFTIAFVSYLPQTKPRKYTVYIDSGIMKRIDAITKNRSAFLSAAALAMLDSK